MDCKLMFCVCSGFPEQSCVLWVIETPLEMILCLQ